MAHGGNAVSGLSENENSRRDIATAIILVAIFFACAFYSITDGCYWGDDYAAYISEGIAISEQRLDIHALLNTKMHPSNLPDEAVGEPLVYVWGYPLILALVYSLVGFDRITYATIFFYKLPTVISFAILSAVLFLFLRRRFGYFFSLLLTVAFCSCSDFYNFVNTLYSDIYFMFFALLSLYLVERYVEESRSPKREIIGIILGITLWYTYEIRLNGQAILLACFAAQLFNIIKNRKSYNQELLLKEIITFITFFTFKSVSELILATPTSNTSDFQDSSQALFISNMGVYLNLILDFFKQIWSKLLISPLYSILRRLIHINYYDLNSISYIFIWGSFALFVVGLVSGTKENLHLSLLVILYILIAAKLPYTQGMRYLYPILPAILMFFGYSVRFVYKLFDNKNRTWLHHISTVAALCLCVLCIAQIALNDIKLKNNGEIDVEIINVEDIYMQNAYSSCAIEAYNYIQANTPKNCSIAFFAPRGLHLNTERFSFKPGVNGHSIEEADYCLEYLKTGGYHITPPIGDEFEKVFSNDEFVLYRHTIDYVN